MMNPSVDKQQTPQNQPSPNDTSNTQKTPPPSVLEKKPFKSFLKIAKENTHPEIINLDQQSLRTYEKESKDTHSRLLTENKDPEKASSSNEKNNTSKSASHSTSTDSNNPIEITESDLNTTPLNLINNLAQRIKNIVNLKKEQPNKNFFTKDNPGKFIIKTNNQSLQIKIILENRKNGYFIQLKVDESLIAQHPSIQDDLKKKLKNDKKYEIDDIEVIADQELIHSK